jgi:DNA-binding Lrp family transcriptional regulator
MTIDSIDRRILSATAGGLPMSVTPYASVARSLDMTEAEVLERIARMQAGGIIRRIAIAPNHYALGVRANGMSVWDVDDSQVDLLGKKVGRLPFVTHCYRRPRALPDWRFNLFAMIHGADRDEVEDKRREIAALLGDACAASDILYSTRILKKSGMRLQKEA